MSDNQKDTVNKLKESAMREFLDKGFNNASLRSICKNAGVTTGALYFFFNDKNDLFASLVQGPLDELSKILEEHMVNEAASVKNTNGNIIEESKDDDTEVSYLIIEKMFANKDAFTLLLTKAQGSSYEHIEDVIIAKMEKHYTEYVTGFARSMGIDSTVDPFTVHYIVHNQVQAFEYLFTHAANKEEAFSKIEPVVRYLRGGWFGALLPGKMK